MKVSQERSEARDGPSCDYFSESCLTILSEYFSSQGFDQVESDQFHVTFFRLDEVFVDIRYSAESSSGYWVECGVGIGSKRFSSTGEFMFVPYWYLLNKYPALQSTDQLQFESIRELEQILLKLRCAFSEVLGKVILKDSVQLMNLILEFRLTALGA